MFRWAAFLNTYGVNNDAIRVPSRKQRSRDRDKLKFSDLPAPINHECINRAARRVD